MQIEREEYLQRLIAKKDNGQIKVITGVRRCGKSYLLFVLYKQHLLQSGVPEDHIVPLALDSAFNAKYRDPLVLAGYLESHIRDSSGRYYVLLDEIQLVGRKKLQSNPDVFVTFYDVLNQLQSHGNVDIYVTGSNSEMLSKDVLTGFRGRGDELRLSPLSFSEFYGFVGGDKEQALDDYVYFGGMPGVLAKRTDAEKERYLSQLFSETYFKDILERNKLAYPSALDMIVDDLCSSVGSLTNPNKIARALKSEQNFSLSSETVGLYLSYLLDSFLFSMSRRYDVKGRRYFSYPSKYYCVDPGLRNARLNFRQIDEGHLLENIVYNELSARGHNVDVGVVEGVMRDGGKTVRYSSEIDFVVNAKKPGEKCYIQCAVNIDDEAKRDQELKPFLKVRNDFSRRIMLTKTKAKPWTDDLGILHIGIYDFLLSKNLWR